MKSMKFYFLFLAILTLGGCQASKVQYCFDINEPEKNSHTWVIIEPDHKPMPQLTVIEQIISTGEKIEQHTLGRFENKAFIYTDGSRFVIDGDRLRGEASPMQGSMPSLIDGMLLAKTSCP